MFVCIPILLNVSQPSSKIGSKSKSMHDLNLALPKKLTDRPGADCHSLRIMDVWASVATVTSPKTVVVEAVLTGRPLVPQSHDGSSVHAPPQSIAVARKDKLGPEDQLESLPEHI